MKQIQQNIYSISRRQALKPCYRKEKTGRTPEEKLWILINAYANTVFSKGFGKDFVFHFQSFKVDRFAYNKADFKSTKKFKYKQWNLIQQSDKGACNKTDRPQ